MKKTLVLTLWVLSCFIADGSLAENLTVFGPKQYLRTNGAPNTYKETFSSISSLPSEATVAVWNGGSDGSNRVTSGEIHVNGKQIAGPNDFKKHVYYVELKIDLREDNELIVKLAGRPESYLTLQITTSARMVMVPDLKGLALAEAETVLADAGLSTGQVAKESHEEVPEGNVISQSPEAGTSVEENCAVNMVVSLGPASMNIDIVSPADGETFASDSITVTGAVSRSGARVLVNGFPATVDGHEFSAPGIPLYPGANTIGALAEAGGDTAAASVSVMRIADVDLEARSIEITSMVRSEGSLKVGGCAVVSIANNGSGEVPFTYRITLFEDRNVSLRYEESEDAFLGETRVAGGPGPMGVMSISVEFIGELLFEDSPIFAAVDASGEVEESNEHNNVSSTRVSGLDVSSSRLWVEQEECPDLVALNIRIGNAGDMPVGTGLPVAFYDGDPDTGGTLIATAQTRDSLALGGYEDVRVEWRDPGSGQLRIYARADDDGAGGIVLAEARRGNNVAFAEISLCGTSPAPGMNSISGTVLDALNGAAISGASVGANKSEGGSLGEVVAQSVTDDYGSFSFSGLDPGDYVLVADIQGYAPGERRLVLPQGKALTHQDIPLSPVLGSDEVRIVLTWGEKPEDLEAHLTTPNSEGCRHHCYYWKREIPGAILDRDDQDSYGPETITITELEAGVYRYYVHDFNNRFSTSSHSLSQSGAAVTVYFGSGDTPRVFYPPSLTGNVWHVFDLDGSTGEIIPGDRMTNQANPGEIDFPVITSTPGETAVWGATYQYEAEARDPDDDVLTYVLMKGPKGMEMDASTGEVMWTPGEGQGGVNDVVIKAIDGRCGEDEQRFRIQVSYKPSVQFSVGPCSGFNPGGSITLSWSTTLAEKVVINRGIGEVAPSGSLTIDSPSDPVSFTLTASNGAGETSKKIPTDPGVTLYHQPDCMSGGEGVALKWSSTCAVSCEINQGIGTVGLEGSLEVKPSESTVYTLTCTNGAGSFSDSTAVDFCPPPSPPPAPKQKVSIGAYPDCEWAPGDLVTLSWETTGVMTCALNQGIGEVPLVGSLVVNPTDPTTYLLSCTGPLGASSDEVMVPKEPLINAFVADPACLELGEATALIWNTSCADEVFLNQSLGEVESAGSIRLQPEALPVTYELTALNEAGSESRSITIDYCKPTATFIAKPAVLKMGERSELTWTTEHAASCFIQPDIGRVALNGSMTVDPGKKTTYSLIASGPGGTTTHSVTVAYVPPTAEIRAEPENILQGESSVLSWVFGEAHTCSVDQGIGEVQLGQSVTVTPTETTTYTMTATGPGGQATDRVAVIVMRPPFIKLDQPDGTGDKTDKAFLIRWYDEDADSDASISLFYYQETGCEGCITETLIVSGLREDPDGTGDEYVWDTSRLPEGEYYVYASITDGVFEPSLSHGLGPVIVEHGSLDESNLRATDAAANDHYGSSVSIDGDYAIVGAYGDDDDGESSGSAYVLKREGSRWMQQAKLAGSDAAAYAYFGRGVSISGEYAIVGAYGAVEESGAAYVYMIEEGRWSEQARLMAGDHAPYDRFGGSVAISGDDAVIGAAGDDDGGEESGAAYIFTREGTSWTEQQKLTAEDAEPGDSFGSSVSVSGDTVLVGAPRKEDFGDYSGAVYVFRKQGGKWLQEAKLHASDARIADQFGISVSVCGDYAVVGKRIITDYGGVGVPSAYVFRREGSQWIEQAILARSGEPLWDSFGSSVSIHGEYAVVGAERYYDPERDTCSGAAYVFRRDGTKWVEQVQLTAADGMENDYFGGAVSLSGDTVIVGARGDDDSGSLSGSVYMYRFFHVDFHAEPSMIESGGSTILSWYSPLAYSCHIDPGIGAVDISGSIEVFPSESTTYQLTASGPDGVVTKGVTVYVVDPATPPAVILRAEPESIPAGDSCSLSWSASNAAFCTIEPGIGNVDLNGTVTLYPFQDTSYTITAGHSGGVASDTVTVSVRPTIVLIEPNGSGGEAHRECVIRWADVDNDDAAVISLYYDRDDEGEDGILIAEGLPEDPDGDGADTFAWNTEDVPEGRYFIYAVIEDGKDRPVVQYSQGSVSVSHSFSSPVEITAGDAASYDLFGYAVSLRGDVAVVGAYGAGHHGYYSGSAYIFRKDGPFFVQEARLTAGDASSNDYFGYAVGIGSDMALVGAHGDDDHGQDSGSVYVFEGNSTEWTEQAKLTAPDAAANDYFGVSVAISGDLAIVGADGDDDSGESSGSAYVFKHIGDSWTGQGKLAALDAAAWDFFGNSVSLSGDYAIVGAPGKDDAGADSGAAYIFRREGSEWTQQAKLTSVDSAAGDHFGFSVSIDGDYAVVGAHGHDDNGYSSGAAYIFKIEDGVWAESAKLIPDDGAADDYFGYAVSISGNCALVGAYRDDDAGSMSGSAYVFCRDEEGGWTQRSKLAAVDPSLQDYFGFSVSISGGMAVVGAYGDDMGYSSSTGSAYVFPVWNVDIWADRETIDTGDAISLWWSSGQADSRAIEPEIGPVEAIGSIEVSPSETTTYVLTATGSQGTLTDSITITVVAPKPSVTISAYPEILSPGESTTLSWTSNHADTCSIEPGIGTVPLSGSITVSPSGNTTYTITASGAGGTATAEVTVGLLYAQPGVTIAADPESIETGQSVNLVWSSSGADSCSMEPGLGSVPCTGTSTVSPSAMTTYEITAQGLGGKATAAVTVCVHDPVNPVQVEIGVDPETIAEGGAATLSWRSTGATSCHLEPDLGPVETSGAIAVTPAGTTTYRIIASGPGGTASDRVTLTVVYLNGIIEGKVVDGVSEQAVAGAKVTASDPIRQHAAETDQAGEFTITGVAPGAVVVAVTQSGYSPLEMSLSLSEGETRSVLIRLEKHAGATLIGKVIDGSSGASLAGAAVSVEDTEKIRSSQSLGDGSYTVTGLTAGELTVTTSLAGYFQTTENMTLPSEQIYTHDIILYPEGMTSTVHGTVTNAATLLPEPDVIITLSGIEISDATDSNGAFRLEHVPMGDQILEAYKEGFVDAAGMITIDRDPYVIELVFPISSAFAYPNIVDTSITGCVMDRMSGAPIAGAKVALYGTDIESVTDSDGIYTLSEMPEGAQSLVAMALNHEAVYLQVTVRGGAAESLSMSLPPVRKGAVEGTIRDAGTGDPIGGATVSIGDLGILRNESEYDGSYFVGFVPEGAYTLSVSHADYEPIHIEFVIVLGEETTGMDVELIRRPVTGSLQGTVTDKDTGQPVPGAEIRVDNRLAGTTDANGYYRLDGLPAGLVTLGITTLEHPPTIRIAAVLADKEAQTSSVTEFDISMDAVDPEPPSSATKEIMAVDGGYIELPDSQFLVVIPPGVLSGDAVVTLRPSAEMPLLSAGDALDVDPELGITRAVALSQPFELVVEPVDPGGKVPELKGWVVFSGRYFESLVTNLNISENSILPYYWDGTQWTILAIKPYEFAVDRINNLPVAVMDISSTAAGRPVQGQTVRTARRSWPKTANDVRDVDLGFLFRFILGGIVKLIADPEPNVKAIEADELIAASTNPDQAKIPNPNAYPLLIIHGWDWQSVLVDSGHMDPNSGMNGDGSFTPEEANRFTYIVKDLVDATNGVYRPVFVTHNSRAGMFSIGNDLASKLPPWSLQGLPSDPDDPNSGRFSTVDTFGYSMGGLIARVYHWATGGVNNMVMAGTPNHGTFEIMDMLDIYPGLSLLKDVLLCWSPGSSDLIAYDDRDLMLFSDNLRLHYLNAYGMTSPQGDMTLIAGNDQGVVGHVLFPPGTDNDGVVSVDSVFGRTSDPDDGDASLLRVSTDREKHEKTFGFSHFNFGDRGYRISDNGPLEDAITYGFSDWVVSKQLNPEDDILLYNSGFIQWAGFQVEVQYNVYGRDIDRIALVIYAKDSQGEWHVAGDYADPSGNIVKWEEISGNSKYAVKHLKPLTGAFFSEDDEIVSVAFEVLRLELGQTKIAVKPNGNFGLPHNENE